MRIYIIFLILFLNGLSSKVSSSVFNTKKTKNNGFFRMIARQAETLSYDKKYHSKSSLLIIKEGEDFYEFLENDNHNFNPLNTAIEKTFSLESVTHIINAKIDINQHERICNIIPFGYSFDEHDYGEEYSIKNNIRKIAGRSEYKISINDNPFTDCPKSFAKRDPAFIDIYKVPFFEILKTKDIDKVQFFIDKKADINCGVVQCFDNNKRFSNKPPEDWRLCVKVPLEFCIEKKDFCLAKILIKNGCQLSYWPNEKVNIEGHDFLLRSKHGDRNLFNTFPYDYQKDKEDIIDFIIKNEEVVSKMRFPWYACSTQEINKKWFNFAEKHVFLLQKDIMPAIRDMYRYNKDLIDSEVRSLISILYNQNKNINRLLMFFLCIKQIDRKKSYMPKPIRMMVSKILICDKSKNLINDKIEPLISKLLDSIAQKVKNGNIDNSIEPDISEIVRLAR